MHFVLGKSEKDKTYLDRLVKHDEDNVETIYEEKLPERVNQAKILRDATDNSISTKVLFFMNSTLQAFFTKLHDLRLQYHFKSKNNFFSTKLIYKLLSLKIPT